MGRPMSGSVLEPSQWDAVPLTANVADDEKPVHPVDIENGFWLGQTEVTIGSYRRFALKHNLEVPTGNDVFPVTGLTWAKAKEYCAAIRGRYRPKRSGSTLRAPVIRIRIMAWFQTLPGILTTATTLCTQWGPNKPTRLGSMTC